MKAPRKKHRRGFLNKNSGMAAFEWTVSTEVAEEWKGRNGKVEPKHAEIQAELTLSDCNRQITLDWGLWGRGELSDRRTKLETFEAEVGAFIDAMNDALDWAEEFNDEAKH